MIPFLELLIKRRDLEWTPPRTLLSFDPGETTGWAMFKYGKLTQGDQIILPIEENSKINGKEFWSLFQVYQPDHVVIEGYRVYGHKAAAHSWSALYTPKLIGYIEGICQFYDVPYSIQMAATKQFCNDDKLRNWGYYDKFKKHCRDAIRHGCYWLLFSK